jgi:hypothetical protein
VKKNQAVDIDLTKDLQGDLAKEFETAWVEGKGNVVGICRRLANMS